MAVGMKDIAPQKLATTYNNTDTLANGASINGNMAQQAAKMAYESGDASGEGTNNLTDKEAAEMALNAVNITVDGSQKYNATYSFQNDQESETLQNKNIVDQGATVQDNKAVNTTNNFGFEAGAENAFYEEDSNRPNYMEPVNQAASSGADMDMTSMTSDLYQQQQATNSGKQLNGMSIYNKQEEDSQPYTCGG